MSADGRFIAFEHSEYSTSAPGGGGVAGVFVWDRQTEGWALMSARGDGTPFAGMCDSPAISPNGNVVAFQCAYGLLGAGVFLYDRTAGQVTHVAGSNARWPALSADGRFVAYISGSWDETVVYVLD